MRIYVSDITHPSSSRIKSALKFIFSFFGIIDLLAVMPFYIPFIITVELRYLRLLRLLRLIRIFKLSRYNQSLQMVFDVIKEKRADLLTTAFLILFTMFTSSFFIYYAEKDAQPDKFPNIPASFWWAIETISTVGYGDIYPITILGKIISSLLLILSIGLIAIPAGILSAGFIAKTKEESKESSSCPHCGKSIKE